MKVHRWFVTIIFLVLVSLILSGCAADRKVVGNTFQSSYPKLNFQVDPQFKYLGKHEWSGFNQASQSLTTSVSQDEEYHVFIPRDAKVRIDKVLYIYIAKTKYYWVDNDPDNKNNLDFGSAKLNGEQYKYYSRIISPYTSSRVTKYIIDSGYALPTCLLFKCFYAFPDKDIMIKIFYVEDAAYSGMSCKNKYSAQTLSDNEKRYISSDLHQNALATIGMSDAKVISPVSIKASPKVEITKTEPISKIPVKKEESGKETPKVIVRGEKVKVGIIEFQNLNEDAKRENLGTIFSEMLTTSFVNSEAFKITEREQLQKVAKELQLSQSGIIDVTQAKQVGKMVGADAIVTGSVIKIGGDLRLDARIIDVQSGIILTAEKIIGKTDLHSISNMADGIVDNLVNKFYRDKKP